MNDDVPPSCGDATIEHDVRRVQKALRRIIRANDMQSRALAKATGLTTAQLVILRGVVELGEVTTTALSAYADLSTATVVTVLDTLEQRGIVERYRSTADRRVVHTRLTGKGRAVVDAVPGPAGTRFASRFSSLPEDERRQVVRAVETLAGIL
ncbi:MAG: MarR family winged helix-turn-helix transcriptional regulator [Pararhizobium sp.]